jgi:hypothetical protein
MNCVYTEAYLYKQNPDGQGEQNWLCDVAERQAVDFFLVDDETGKSILVKAGYGAGITTIVVSRFSFCRGDTFQYVSPAGFESSRSTGF